MFFSEIPRTKDLVALRSHFDLQFAWYLASFCDDAVKTLRLTRRESARRCILSHARDFLAPSAACGYDLMRYALRRFSHGDEQSEIIDFPVSADGIWIDVNVWNEIGITKVKAPLITKASLRSWMDVPYWFMGPLTENELSAHMVLTFYARKDADADWEKTILERLKTQMQKAFSISYDTRGLEFPWGVSVVVR